MGNSDEKLSIGQKPLSTKEPRVVNYYIALAIDVILLYFFNNIVFANIIFLSAKDLTSCLWAINLALGVGIIGNFIFLLYRPRWFRHMVQAVLSALAILAVYTIFRVFPFTFSDDIFRTITRAILIIIMVGAGIGFVVEMVKSGIAWIHKEPPPTSSVLPVAPPQPEPLPVSPVSGSGPEPPLVSPGSPSKPEPPSEPNASPLPPEPPQSG